MCTCVALCRFVNMHADAEEGVKYSGAVLQVVLSHPMWVLESNLGPLEEQHILLTIELLL